jgi:hypothetical protein
MKSKRFAIDFEKVEKTVSNLDKIEKWKKAYPDTKFEIVWTAKLEVRITDKDDYVRSCAAGSKHLRNINSRPSTKEMNKLEMETMAEAVDLSDSPYI